MANEPDSRDNQFVCRVHHRCHVCGGSGGVRKRDPDWRPLRGTPTQLERRHHEMNSYYIADCEQCKGSGVSHVTLSPETTHDPRKADWLMPDDVPLRGISLGNRRT